mgnify:CR=1 FL=1
MSNCCPHPTSVAARGAWRSGDAARFPDLHNLPKMTWRRAFDGLLGPALRMHHYRNLRGALIANAMRRNDCGTEE